MSDEQAYVLGTHDDEVRRLGLQHRVWRWAVQGVWRKAGFSAGQTVLDVGCGPGYATIDLAAIVGTQGRVVAVDQSPRFLKVLEASARQQGLGNISSYELNFDRAALPDLQVDGAWCRWIFAFVKDPRALLERVAAVMKPGGMIAIHEYFDYATWRAAPPCVELNEFVAKVITSWRASGGEPDIGLQLPLWLHELGFDLVSHRPLIAVLSPGDSMWQWLRSFTDVGRHRLVELGYLTKRRADEIWAAFMELEARSESLLITPGVLELVARKREA